MPDKPTFIDSLTARALAEYATSMRRPEGEPLYFLVEYHPDTDQTTIRTVDQAEKAKTDDAVVVPCDTLSVQPHRPKVEYVRIKADKGKEMQLDDYDAVFWSEAAVEKFLFPYYASKYQWAASYVLEALSKVFYGYLPTPNKELRRGVASDPDGIPFAIGHIPRSDYVPLEESARPGHELAILFRNADGTVSHRRLTEFL